MRLFPAYTSFRPSPRYRLLSGARYLSRAERAAPDLADPPRSIDGFYLRVLLVTTLLLALVTTFTSLAIRLAIPTPDAPTLYSDLVGQPVDALEAAGFSCFSSRPQHDYDAQCSLYPRDSAIAQVNVAAFNGSVVQIRLFPRKGQLTLGNLTAAWGQPRFIRYEGYSEFVWAADGITANSFDVSRNVTYHSAISSVRMSARS